MILGTTAAVSITTAPPKECPTNLTGMLQELYVSYISMIDSTRCVG
jgi:hypothetical protein